MKTLGFPLAPMILGVVLGDIAELNLSRAFAISSDLTHFVLRPWSLFFLLLAAFSTCFPLYQRDRQRRRWTRGYAPLMAAALSLPMFMMGGAVRPTVGATLLLWALWTAWRRGRAGWAIPGDDRRTGNR